MKKLILTTGILLCLAPLSSWACPTTPQAPHDPRDSAWDPSVACPHQTQYPATEYVPTRQVQVEVDTQVIIRETPLDVEGYAQAPVYAPVYQAPLVQPKFLSCGYPTPSAMWEDSNRNSMRGVWNDGAYFPQSGNPYSAVYEGKLVTEVDFTWSCDMDQHGDIVGGFDQTQVITYLKSDHRSDFTYKCYDPSPRNGIATDRVCKGVLDEKAFGDSINNLVAETTLQAHCPVGNYSITRVEIKGMQAGVVSLDPQTQPSEGLEPRLYPMKACSLDGVYLPSSW